MKTIRTGLMALALVATAACADNPVLAPDVHEEFDVEVSFSEASLSTLTTIEVEVAVADHEGSPVTEFELVELEYRMEGAEAWTTQALGLHDGHFSASFTFHSSGEYEARVRAQAHGADHAETIHEVAGHLEVERIHRIVSEYRVEMETYPGEVHEGAEADVKFWVTESADGHHMGGMTAEIHLAHVSTANSMTHAADEHAEGIYETHHTFGEHGETEVTLDFLDGHGEHHEASFHVIVNEAH